MDNNQASNAFLFSVIIPVYNVEDYLEETINSIINQSIGFGHIQLILVNDGSLDASGDICKRYAEKYPDNILYLKQTNKGVSSARNRGLRLAEGKYITFFDSDDVWDLDAFKHVEDLFSSSDVSLYDVVSCRLVQFGARTDRHPLDYRYEASGVVDLLKQPDFISPMIGNCFFRHEAIVSLEFDESTTYGEDTVFLTKVLLKKCRYYCTNKAVYYYRKRLDGSSLSQRMDVARILQGNDFCLQLQRLSSKKYNEVLPFIQILCLYEVKWRLFSSVTNAFSQDNAEEYRVGMHALLQNIEDCYIYKDRNITVPKVVYLLKSKYGNDFFKKVQWVKGRAYYQGVRVYSPYGAQRFYITNLDVVDQQLHIIGTTDVQLLDLPFELIMRDKKGEDYPVKLSEFSPKDISDIVGDKVMSGMRFETFIPVSEGMRLTPVLRLMNSEKEIYLHPGFGLFGKLTHKRRNSYSVFGKWIFKFINREIRVYKYKRTIHIASELRYDRSIFREVKTKGFTIVGLRWLSFIFGVFKRKPIWIINDRDDKAGDNGENLFKYIKSSKKRSDSVSVYFALRKTSGDFSRIRKVGKTLQPYSLKYNVFFLLADAIISPHSDSMILNPFRVQGTYYADIMHYDYICLSHGTLQGDLSRQLNVTKINARLFIVSSMMEFNALTSSEYGYSEREVKVAGMARYDAFDPNHWIPKILFLPTWRVNIAGKIIPGTRLREYVPDFKDTEYCRFYNELINDKRLLSVMKKHGYRGEFYVHPSFEKQCDDFYGNEVISVGKTLANYEKVLDESALLVTDYSGIAFDFAYQRKPIVYCHFDDLFNGSHSYKTSYFDYSQHGFGPIAQTVDDAVNYIATYIECNCQESEKYKLRADEFYAFSDRKNSQRVFEELAKSQGIE